METRQMTRSTAAPRRSRRPSAKGGEDLSRQIQEKAFELYQRRGGTHGDDQADWFEAERLVRQGRVRSTAGAGRSAAPRSGAGRARTTPGHRKTGRKAGS